MLLLLLCIREDPAGQPTATRLSVVGGLMEAEQQHLN